MALIGELNATTEYYWLNAASPQDIVSKASPLLWKLMGNAIQYDLNGQGPGWVVKPHETVDGGNMVKVVLEYANSNSGSYGATTVINQAKSTIMDAARFRWGGLYGSNTLNLDDKVRNSGAEAIVDLTKTYVNSIIKSARINMASAIIAAAPDSASINGLEDLFNTNTAVAYGSITEAAMASWKANVITTAAPISYSVMQEIFRAPNMGDHVDYLPNFVVTTPTIRDGYKLSLHPQQRYTDTDMVKAGWPNIWHDQAPIVSDTYIGVGVMYALNLNYLSLRAHKDYNFTLPKWVDKEVLGQPDTMSANTRFVGNLYCSNRQMQVKRLNLTVPV